MKKQSVILVTSPQGGAGKSTISINLAIHYAKQNLNVLIVDFANYGSFPSMLKIPIRGKGMSSLITALEQNEEDLPTAQFTTYFKDAVVAYEHQENLHIMLSASPLKMEKLSSKQANSIIQAAKNEHYDIIIMDTSSELCERNIACIESSDLIVIPTLQDVTSGWKVILFKEVLDNLNIARDRVSIVANRCTKYSGFNNQEFQAETGYPIIAEIEDLSKIVQRRVNVGVPIVNSGVKRASAPFHRLAEKVLAKVGV